MIVGLEHMRSEILLPLRDGFYDQRLRHGAASGYGAESHDSLNAMPQWIGSPRRIRSSGFGHRTARRGVAR